VWQFNKPCFAKNFTHTEETPVYFIKGAVYMSTEKAYCANCLNCTVFRQFESDNKSFVLRVRCDKKKWLKRSGEEKVHKYFTVARRVMDECDEYIESGELYPYIKNLRKALPVKDELYAVEH